MTGSFLATAQQSPSQAALGALCPYVRPCGRQPPVARGNTGPCLSRPSLSSPPPALLPTLSDVPDRTPPLRSASCPSAALTLLLPLRGPSLRPLSVHTPPRHPSAGAHPPSSREEAPPSSRASAPALSASPGSGVGTRAQNLSPSSLLQKEEDLVSGVQCSAHAQKCSFNDLSSCSKRKTHFS